jgi:hypothetical protein
LPGGCAGVGVDAQERLNGAVGVLAALDPHCDPASVSRPMLKCAGPFLSVVNFPLPEANAADGPGDVGESDGGLIPLGTDRVGGHCGYPIS